MKFAVFVAAASCAAVQGANLRESVQAALEADESMFKNDPVCMKIYDSWWTSRESEKTRDEATALDAICAQFTKDPDACNHKSSRSGSMSKEAKDAACTMVGAHSPRCIANPCNHYNIGKCTLQETGGQCHWWTKDDVKKLNAYYKKEGIKDYSGKTKVIKGHGCFRNPCNMPGYKNSPKKDCNSGTGEFGVPGVFQCTWCDGVGKLKGSGMGCQMKTVTSKAACAPVNDKSEQDTVWELIADTSCQCSDSYTYCYDDVNDRSADFRKKK